LGKRAQLSPSVFTVEAEGGAHRAMERREEAGGDGAAEQAKLLLME
jgi:hypothetical protein